MIEKLIKISPQLDWKSKDGNFICRIDNYEIRVSKGYSSGNCCSINIVDGCGRTLFNDSAWSNIDPIARLYHKIDSLVKVENRRGLEKFCDKLDNISTYYTIGVVIDGNKDEPESEDIVKIKYTEKDVYRWPPLFKSYQKAIEFKNKIPYNFAKKIIVEMRT